MHTYTQPSCTNVHTYIDNSHIPHVHSCTYYTDSTVCTDTKAMNNTYTQYIHTHTHSHIHMYMRTQSIYTHTYTHMCIHKHIYIHGADSAVSTDTRALATTALDTHAHTHCSNVLFYIYP